MTPPLGKEINGLLRFPPSWGHLPSTRSHWEYSTRVTGGQCRFFLLLFLEMVKNHTLISWRLKLRWTWLEKNTSYLTLSSWQWISSRPLPLLPVKTHFPSSFILHSCRQLFLSSPPLQQLLSHAYSQLMVMLVISLGRQKDSEEIFHKPIPLYVYTY